MNLTHSSQAEGRQTNVLIYEVFSPVARESTCMRFADIYDDGNETNARGRVEWLIVKSVQDARMQIAYGLLAYRQYIKPFESNEAATGYVGSLDRVSLTHLPL